MEGKAFFIYIFAVYFLSQIEEKGIDLRQMYIVRWQYW